MPKWLKRILTVFMCILSWLVGFTMAPRDKVLNRSEASIIHGRGYAVGVNDALEQYLLLRMELIQQKGETDFFEVSKAVSEKLRVPLTRLK